MTNISGRRILIVEDEMLIALMMQDILEELGCMVVGMVPRLEAALRFIEAHSDGLDAATLDVNLGDGETSLPIAEKLDAHGIPFIVASGYDDAPHLAGFENRPRVNKPFQSRDVERALGLLSWRDKRH